MNKDNKKKILIISIISILVIGLVFGITYSFLRETLNANKKVILSAGMLDLVLDEKNEITISDALPMYDEVGMIQEEVFNFSLINNTHQANSYTLKLQKIAGDNELALTDVKYGLIKDGEKTIALLSTLTDGVIDTGTITGGDTIEYELRLWINNTVKNLDDIQGKSLSYKITAEASVVEESANSRVTFAGITKEVNETVDAMFNYTSEGIDPLGGDSTEATNGIYMMEDDDGPSYYYRGDVNNIVKFGSYTKDYEVYRYDDYDFVTLEACKYYNSNCSESNKVTKYTAVDNLPMYWKIIRVNGDGTIRMIYAGTTPDAIGYDTGIGVSRYNEEYDNPKYTGYSYDRTTTEVNSDAKTEIDTWYKNVFEGTIYDNLIATGKFCSDSSDYGEVTAMGETMNIFGPSKRSFANIIGTGESSITFKCPTTSETYGGSYNLKAGLITADEIVAAGGQITSNNTYYLYNGTEGNDDGAYYWSMSPGEFSNNGADVGYVYSDGCISNYSIYSHGGLLRPVINLRADIVFKEGTDGSITSPYELAE